MQKIGTLKNVTGDFVEKSMSLFEEDGVTVLESDKRFGRTVIDLSEDLVSVVCDERMRTSKLGVASKTALGAIAGSAWSRNSGGLMGTAMGLGSAINTEKSVVDITLNLYDGDVLHAQTDIQTAKFLQSISPQHTSQSLDEERRENQRYERMFADAPRTHKEVKAEIKKLNAERSIFDDLRENAETFDEREDAFEQYTTLEKQITEKQELLLSLEAEIKAHNAGYATACAW